MVLWHPSWLPTLLCSHSDPYMRLVIKDACKQARLLLPDIQSEPCHGAVPAFCLTCLKVGSWLGFCQFLYNLESQCCLIPDPRANLVCICLQPGSHACLCPLTPGTPCPPMLWVGSSPALEGHLPIPSTLVTIFWGPPKFMNPRFIPRDVHSPSTIHWFSEAFQVIVHQKISWWGNHKVLEDKFWVIVK